MVQVTKYRSSAFSCYTWPCYTSDLTLMETLISYICLVENIHVLFGGSHVLRNMTLYKQFNVSVMYQLLCI